jgi:glycosyltransferase involved in cell wall biosynthesis
MQICLYSPYFPKHLGGGEKYLLDTAQVLAEKHQVSLAVSSLKPLTTAQITEMRHKYETFFNISLDAVSLIATPIGTEAGIRAKLNWTRQFDILYYQTDGSLFFSLARKNILHIQVPLKLNKSSLSEQLKLRNWQVKNTNSEFTKSVIEKWWKTTIDTVHHPMIEVPTKYQNQPKEKVIVSVGRFFRQLHSKRQDVMVEMFKTMRAHNPIQTKGWKLVLIGAVEDQTYADEVTALAKGHPIELYHDLSRPQLLSWLAKAAIYWHAAGYEVDETAHPEKVEHFGISTVEAMACGCVPVVHAKGGQKEVLGSTLQEYGWQTAAEGIEKTVELLADSKHRKALCEVAQAQAAQFGRKIFTQKLIQMVEGKV